jgi:hypothetical protein
VANCSLSGQRAFAPGQFLPWAWVCVRDGAYRAIALPRNRSILHVLLVAPRRIPHLHLHTTCYYVCHLCIFPFQFSSSQSWISSRRTTSSSTSQVQVINLSIYPSISSRASRPGLVRLSPVPSKRICTHVIVASAMFTTLFACVCCEVLPAQPSPACSSQAGTLART